VTQSSQLERIAFSGQDRADFIAGAKRPAQQPHGMKVLNPLAGGGIRIYSYLVNIHGGGIYRLAYTPISTPFQ